MATKVWVSLVSISRSARHPRVRYELPPEVNQLVSPIGANGDISLWCRLLVLYTIKQMPPSALYMFVQYSRLI